MNHLTQLPYNGNLPHGVSQADIDRAFGGTLSDAAFDALEVHARIQHLRMALLEALRANEGVMCVDLYEDLEGSLIDAEYTTAQLEDRVAQADADAAEDEKAAAAEMRHEARRDEMMWGDA